MESGHPTYISSSTTTQVFIGRGKLVRIILGETAAGAITIYDNTGSGTTNTVCVLKASIVEGTYEIGAELQNGCKIVTAAASKLTVITA